MHVVQICVIIPWNYLQPVCAGWIALIATLLHTFLFLNIFCDGFLAASFQELVGNEKLFIELNYASCCMGAF